MFIEVVQMRDIPVFTTDNGVASLIFKKIPYTKEAYIHIRDSSAPVDFVKECAELCRMAGAEKILATGHRDLADKTLYCMVLRYFAVKDQLPQTQAVALPLSIEQTDWWRQIYNRKMANVPSAAPLSESDVKRLADESKAFCIYRECSMQGIGVAYDGCIQAVISLLPGGGRDVVLALANILDSTSVCLSVASTNEKAISLYRSLGFVETEIEAHWYKIL